MPVSPADFYAYSQATGTPVPEDPGQRAQLAPSVMEFRRNQLKQTQEPSIDPLSAGVGIGLALAGAGAAGLATRRMLRSGKTTGQSGTQTVNLENLQRAAGKKPTRQEAYARAAAKPESELPPVTRPQSGVDVELITDPNTGEIYRPGGGRFYADVMTGADLAAQVDEIAQDISQNALTDLHKRQAAALSNQQINAVESGEDQMTGRMRQQLQRNEDIDLSSVDQFEVLMGPATAEETQNLAKQEMIQRRQGLIEQGFQPGTTRFEKALAQSFRTDLNVTPGMTGETMQKTTLPAGPIRQTVQEVSASQYLPEFSVENIGPEAEVTKTALGTAIRGASPVLEQQPPVIRERQIFGTPDVNVPGAPDEMMPDRPARESALSQILTEPQVRQDPYAIAQEEGGGPAGIGVYGVEPSYVPGAQSKASGAYSAASQRKPTDLPYPERKGTGLTDMTTSDLQNFAEKAVQKNPRAAQAAMSELERRQKSKTSLQVSEAIRRAKIEGRDPQSLLRSLGFGV